MRYYPTLTRSFLAFLALALLITLPVSAQSRFDHWFFGLNAGLDFSGGSPVADPNGALSTLEGSAAISDESGVLLFYTDGVTVWNRTHAVMPNGGDLMGHWTSAQSALIVPVPENANRYLLFTAGAGFYHTATDPNNGVRYSVVDMALDAGQGDVVEKNVELIPRGDATEMLNATRHCNGRDYWVIAHELESDRFVAYLVDRNGISDTVVSRSGTVRSGNNGTQSMAKFSPNGKMIAVATPGDRTLELFDFDNLTGTVSNARVLRDDYYYYGPEFSPDNTKLYSSTLALEDEPDFLYQFDLEAGDLAAVQSSRIILHRENGRWDGAQLQLGPDGRIYASFISRNQLGIIQQPNLAGTNAAYVHNGIALSGRTTQYGLPNCISADMFPSDDAVRLSTSVTSTSIRVAPGGSETVEIIVCNTSQMIATNVVIDVSLASPLTVQGANPFPLTIPTLAASECDTIRLSLANDAPPESDVGVRFCVDAQVDSTSPCAGGFQSTTCIDLVAVGSAPVTGSVDYSFYLPAGCPGISQKALVLFNSRRFTDTITSISFVGKDAGSFSYDGPEPVQIAIRPTSDQYISIEVFRPQTDTATAIMVLATNSRDTFRIRLIARMKPFRTGTFDVSSTSISTLPGPRDTCITLTNLSGQPVRIFDVAWKSVAPRALSVTSPSLPATISSGGTLTLCLTITGFPIDETLTLGGSEIKGECPACLSHVIRFTSTSSQRSLSVDSDRFDLASAIRAAPNPAFNETHISVESGRSEYCRLLLIDVAGREVLEIFSGTIHFGTNTFPVNTSDIPVGQYWVQVQMPDRLTVRPLTIQR